MAKRDRARLLLLPALVALLLAGSGAQAGRRGTARTKPALLDDPARVPFDAEAQISGNPLQFGVPKARARVRALVADRIGKPNEKNRLPVRMQASGSLAKWLDPMKVHAFKLKLDGRVAPLIFYVKAGDWHVASAALLRARIRKLLVEFLDADADGRFDGPADYVRSGESAFRPVTKRTLQLVPKGLARLSLSDDAKHVTLDPVARPEGVDDGCWRALLRVNRFRGGAGMPLMLLDKRKSQGCRLHARYLYLNKDQQSTPVDETHNERVGKDGYTKLGHEAARVSGMHYEADAEKAVAGLLPTLLHRSSFAGPASQDMGVGAVSGSLVGGIPGYTVIWGAEPAVGPSDTPLCIPGPGQGDSGARGGPEIPDVEKYPGWMDSRRGNPISVYFGRMKLTDTRFRVSAVHGKRRVEIAGYAFSPAEPVTSTRPANDHAAFFVAEQPFKAGTVYEVVFEARQPVREGEPRPVRLVWSFRAQPMPQ